MPEGADSGSQSEVSQLTAALSKLQGGSSSLTLPKFAGQYHDWRNSVRAAVLSAASDVVAARDYLKGLDDETLTLKDLGVPGQTSLERLDVKLYSCILQALTLPDDQGQHAVELARIRREIEAADVFGEGRKAMRILDTQMKYVAKRRKTDALLALLALEAGASVNAFLTELTFLAKNAGADEDLSVALIRLKLGSRPECTAALAAWAARPIAEQTLVSLTEPLQRLENESTNIFQPEATYALVTYAPKGKGKGKGKGRKGERDQSEDLCNYCKKPGHWKRDCRQFKRDQEQEPKGSGKGKDGKGKNKGADRA